MLKDFVIIGDSSVKENLNAFSAISIASEKLELFWNHNKRGKKLKGELEGLYSLRFPLKDDEGRLIFYPFYSQNIVYLAEADKRSRVYAKAKRKRKVIKTAVKAVNELNLNCI